MKPTLLLATFLVVGCAKKTPQPEVSNAPAAKKMSDAPAQPAAATLAAATKLMTANFSRVHFEFDSTKLSEPTRDALEANAEIMKAHPTLQVEVQGHADDRGTSEYNLALGEKRAGAVRAYLAKLGVTDERIQIISYGEEKPLQTGSSEVVWSKNRRAEFRVTLGGDEVAGTTE